jgi:hypothetical protein
MRLTENSYYKKWRNDNSFRIAEHILEIDKPCGDNGSLVLGPGCRGGMNQGLLPMTIKWRRKDIYTLVMLIAWIQNM